MNSELTALIFIAIISIVILLALREVVYYISNAMKVVNDLKEQVRLLKQLHNHREDSFNNGKEINKK